MSLLLFRAFPLLSDIFGNFSRLSRDLKYSALYPNKRMPLPGSKSVWSCMWDDGQTSSYGRNTPRKSSGWRKMHHDLFRHRPAILNRYVDVWCPVLYIFIYAVSDFIKSPISKLMLPSPAWLLTNIRKAIYAQIKSKLSRLVQTDRLSSFCRVVLRSPGLLRPISFLDRQSIRPYGAVTHTTNPGLLLHVRFSASDGWVVSSNPVCLAHSPCCRYSPNDPALLGCYRQLWIVREKSLNR